MLIFARWRSPYGLIAACPAVLRRAARPGGGQIGGDGGIRTLDRALQPYNGLANRRLQPLGHSSVAPDMPERSLSWQATQTAKKRRENPPVFQLRRPASGGHRHHCTLRLRNLRNRGRLRLQPVARRAL